MTTVQGFPVEGRTRREALAAAQQQERCLERLWQTLRELPEALRQLGMGMGQVARKLQERFKPLAEELAARRGTESEIERGGD